MSRSTDMASPDLLAFAGAVAAGSRIDHQPARPGQRVQTLRHAERRIERSLGLAVGHELDRGEQAFTADVADQRLGL